MLKPTINTLHNLLCVSLFLFAVSSCDRYVDFLRVDMQDGTEITPKKGVKSYPTEDEFVHAVAFPDVKYNGGIIVSNDYSADSRYEIDGENHEYAPRCSWEIAKLGEWAAKYGLKPGEQYYVCTTVRYVFTSLPPEGYMFVPKNKMDDMGYCPSHDEKTFSVAYDWNERVAVFATSVHTIAYDASGKTVNVSIPQIDSVKWQFQVITDGWSSAN